MLLFILVKFVQGFYSVTGKEYSRNLTSINNIIFLAEMCFVFYFKFNIIDPVLFCVIINSIIFPSYFALIRLYAKQIISLVKKYVNITNFLNLILIITMCNSITPYVIEFIISYIFHSIIGFKKLGISYLDDKTFKKLYLTFIGFLILLIFCLYIIFMILLWDFFCIKSLFISTCLIAIGEIVRGNFVLFGFSSLVFILFIMAMYDKYKFSPLKYMAVWPTSILCSITCPALAFIFIPFVLCTLRFLSDIFYKEEVKKLKHYIFMFFCYMVILIIIRTFVNIMGYDILMYFLSYFSINLSEESFIRLIHGGYLPKEESVPGIFLTNMALENKNITINFDLDTYISHSNSIKNMPMHEIIAKLESISITSFRVIDNETLAYINFAYNLGEGNENLKLNYIFLNSQFALNNGLHTFNKSPDIHRNFISQFESKRLLFLSSYVRLQLNIDPLHASIKSTSFPPINTDDILIKFSCRYPTLFEEFMNLRNTGKIKDQNIWLLMQELYKGKIDVSGQINLLQKFLTPEAINRVDTSLWNTPIPKEKLTELHSIPLDIDTSWYINTSGKPFIFSAGRLTSQPAPGGSGSLTSQISQQAGFNTGSLTSQISQQANFNPWSSQQSNINTGSSQQSGFNTGSSQQSNINTGSSQQSGYNTGSKRSAPSEFDFPSKRRK